MVLIKSKYLFLLLLLPVIAAEPSDSCILIKDTFNVALSDQDWLYDDDYYTDIVLKYHIRCENVTLNSEKSILGQLDEEIYLLGANQITLRIINSSLKNVTKAFLQDLNSVTEYYLINSSISYVELDALNLESSSILHLDNNQLSDINPIFSGSCGLNEISLDNNIISDFDSFQNCVILQTINLNHNNISIIRENHFSNLRYLSRLLLSSNNISSIHEKAFENLPRLKTLDLSVNSLETLPRNLFTDLEDLIFLNISFNNLKDMSFPYMPMIFKYTFTSRISNLFLNFNNFTSVPNNLNNSNSHSMVLYLSNNNIKNISVNEFRQLNETRELHLENNLIESIEIGSFKDVKALETLNLSNNKLNKIEMGTFSGLNVLRILNLSYNKFIILDTAVFFTLESLVQLDFNGNYLHALNTTNLHFQNLKNISLDFHNISCHSLIQYINSIKAHGITLSQGNSFNNSNVNGIACIHTSLHHSTTTSSTTVPTTTASTTELVINSTAKLESSTTEITTTSAPTPQSQMTTTSEKTMSETTNSNLEDIHTSTSHTALILTLVFLLVVVFGVTIWFSKKYYQKRKIVDETEYNFLNMHDTVVDD